MMVSRALPNKQLDPAIIAGAPDDLEPSHAFDMEESKFYEGLVGDLSFELQATKAQLQKLTGQQTSEQVRAALIEPYANKVYNFVVGYCGVVAVFLLLAAYKKLTGFDLSDTILSIIAGSTAVAVVGLIGMVVSGLFGATKSEARAPQD